MRVITESQIDIAAQAINDGQLIIMPTSRWYMVCCAADNQQACQSIFAAKQRAESKSLALVVPSKKFAAEHFVLSKSANCLIEHFWPGDLALLLSWKNPQVGERHAAVGNPNALVTSDPGPLGALATATGRPLAETTVNTSSATTAVEFGPAITLEQVKEFLKVSKMEIAAAIDGGICPAANHLTIIDCLADKPGAVRSGLVHARAVNAALGKVAEALDPISVESLLQISEASPPVTTLQMRPEETQMQTISRRSARAILLNEANELGLIKRTKLSQLPYWTTPGGGIEETDKSLEDALRRELREELGAEINELQQVTLISTPATDGTVSVQHFFVCRLAELDTNRRSGPELNDASRGGYDFEFVALEELDTVDLKPAEIRTFIHSNRVALISFDQ